MPDKNKENQTQKRPCPVCGESMKIEHVLQAEVDVCEEHGVWLDEGELDLIISRLRQNRTRIKDAAAKSARKQGRIQGWLFGPLSFLFGD